MPTQDPLAQLRDIHLPANINVWPPAIGWWIVTLLAIALLGYMTYKIYQHVAHNRYRKQGLVQLIKLDQVNTDASDYLQQLNRLLKQTALSAGFKQDIASLSGDDWLALLDRSAATNDFSQGVGSVLSQGPYAPEADDYDRKQLHSLARAWIKKHRVSKGDNSDAKP
jgi:predicted negative regulator of RcsB-dependent stress response